MACSIEDLAGQLVTWAGRIRGTKYLDEIFETVKVRDKILFFIQISMNFLDVFRKSIKNWSTIQSIHQIII